MRIENRSFEVTLAPRGPRLEAVAAALRETLPRDHYPLRFAVVGLRDATAEIEATLLAYAPREPYAGCLDEVELFEPRRMRRQSSRFCAVQVVPTGIRCEIGGFAGDACPATNLLASAVDCLVTHPNAVNASELNEAAANSLYVEGKALDDFLLGHIGLLPVASNKIGTAFDPTGTDYFAVTANALDAARAAAGIDCALHVVLAEELGVRIAWSETGCAVGTLENPATLIDGVQELIDAGAQAVGAVSVIHGSSEAMLEQHLKGSIPNPSGGAEAILTHLITKLFRVPTAHAPLPYYQETKGTHTTNPRAAAEFISTPHYFSVLKGLHRAPRLFPLGPTDVPPPDVLSVADVGAVVAPASALGGIPALAAEYHGIPLIAVRENRTILDVDNAKLRMDNVIEVESYLEAAGVLLALRRGIALESLRRPLRAASETLATWRRREER
jgi:hypothetical protein